MRISMRDQQYIQEQTAAGVGATTIAYELRMPIMRVVVLSHVLKGEITAPIYHHQDSNRFQAKRLSAEQDAQLYSDYLFDERADRVAGSGHAR